MLLTVLLAVVVGYGDRLERTTLCSSTGAMGLNTLLLHLMPSEEDRVEVAGGMEPLDPEEV